VKILLNGEEIAQVEQAVARNLEARGLGRNWRM